VASLSIHILICYQHLLWYDDYSLGVASFSFEGRVARAQTRKNTTTIYIVFISYHLEYIIDTQEGK